MKVGKPVVVDGFASTIFKAFRCHNHEVHEFSLAYIPFMNPYDWILLVNIVTKDKVKYEPIYQFLKKTIRSYILEVSKIDIEIVAILKRTPILKPFPPPENVGSF